jgi:hypothetical protein
MQYALVPLKIGHLTNSEFASLVSMVIETGGEPGLPLYVDNEIWQSYLREMNKKLDIFMRSLYQRRKRCDTEAIVTADHERETAFRVLRRAIKLAAMSDVVEEAEAARVLMIVLKRYKKLVLLNYEAQTKETSLLVTLLQSDEYAPHVNTLGLQRYVARLEAANNHFRALFDDRIRETALGEKLNARTLRIELADYYRQAMLYLQVMANLPGNEHFVLLLRALNISRKGFRVLLARRQNKHDKAGMVEEVVE